MLSVAEIQLILENNIKNKNISKEPKNLYEPINYILNLGGKRLRPLLTLLSYQLFKNDVPQIVDTALSLEFFHNFTLIHDDIMDKANLRRNQPTIHKKWNENIAILSGDALMIKAYELLESLDDSILKIAFKRFNHIALEVCEGQQMDMDFENTSSVSEDQYLEMIRLKTAVLIGFSLEFGSILSHTNSTISKQIYDIGENIGIGFQLMDDYLDVYAEGDKFGKKKGGDILANKKTYLLTKALQLANNQQKSDLLYWLKNDNPEDSNNKIEAITTIYNQLSIPEITKNKTNTYIDKGIKELKTLSVNNEEAKQIMLDFLIQLINRAS